MKIRLKITLDCNKKCYYCINNNLEYKKKWIEVDNTKDIDYHNATSIIISGGEPIMYVGLEKLLRRIRVYTEIPIYLQTNGILLTKYFVKKVDNYIDGIGISIHNAKEFLRYLTRYKDILKIKPIQLYIQDKKYIKDIIDWKRLEREGFTLRVWKKNEFDKNEKIYLLNRKLRNG